MSEWQPIETAPKDEDILAYWPKSDRGPAFKSVVRYNPNALWEDHMPTHWQTLPESPMSSER